VQWSIDCADAYSVAKVRHAVVDQLQKIIGRHADLFNVETVLGELLGAEMERGHLALVITVEHAVGGACVHVYTQGRPGITGTQGELRQAILRGARLPMAVETTSQGTHIILRVPSRHEEAFKQGRPSKPA
jgi:hypothetical protein